MQQLIFDYQFSEQRYLKSLKNQERIKRNVERYIQEHKQKGLCIFCKDKATNGRLCKTHSDRAKKYSKEHYEANKEEINFKRRIKYKEKQQ